MTMAITVVDLAPNAWGLIASGPGNFDIELRTRGVIKLREASSLPVGEPDDDSAYRVLNSDESIQSSLDAGENLYGWLGDSNDNVKVSVDQVVITSGSGGSAAEGAIGDAAWSGTGNGTIVAILKAIWTKLAYGQGVKTGSLSVTVASDDDLQGKLGALTETAPANDTASSGLNGRLQRIAQNLTSLFGAKVTAVTALGAGGSGTIGWLSAIWDKLSTQLAFGQGVKAASHPVTIASDDDIQGKIGSLTETAPASDTASSGLNGRLQRVAQRLTSLIAQVPAVLGQTTKSGSLAVTIASDDDLQAKVGSLTETAPASDTASSGLNGRLQRIAQNLTTMTGRAVAQLGARTVAQSPAVNIATDDAILGAINETAPASDTATAGHNGRLQRIAQRLTSLIALLPVALGQGTMAQSMRVVLPSDQSTLPVNQTTAAYDIPLTITRPANTTAYSANDDVGGALTFANAGPSGATIMITGAQLELDISAIPSGMTSFRLYLYSATPPSALADNAAWDLPSGDRSSYLGYIDLGTPIDLGSTCYCEVFGLAKQIKLASTSLYGYLVTNGGYTSAANSEVYVVTLHAVAV
jgi:hypothetical protein